MIHTHSLAALPVCGPTAPSLPPPPPPPCTPKQTGVAQRRRNRLRLSVRYQKLKQRQREGPAPLQPARSGTPHVARRRPCSFSIDHRSKGLCLTAALCRTSDSERRVSTATATATVEKEREIERPASSGGIRAEGRETRHQSNREETVNDRGTRNSVREGTGSDRPVTLKSSRIHRWGCIKKKKRKKKVINKTAFSEEEEEEERREWRRRRRRKSSCTCWTR
jgi:hypothetical protein